MVEGLARHALFADASAETLAELADTVREETFREGEWVLREGNDNCGLHVVLEGAAAIVIDGEERAVLHEGMFFGEISALLGEPVSADVVARTPLRCAVIGRDELIPFLLANSSVTFRLLQAEVRRLADTTRWRA